MSSTLSISVRLHEGWYHGSGGPPSPARLFQALVAGAGISGPLACETVESLEWLEKQPPPIVASPHTTPQKRYVNYVPNNDLDAKQGDHRRLGDIRVKKEIAPLVFDPTIPFLFAWKLEDEAAVESAKTVTRLADRVYQLGRCIDMAWAWSEILTEEELQERLGEYPGAINYPAAGTGDVDCPTPGSLSSLMQRYQAGAHQFDTTADGKGQTFRQRPKPRWTKVCYEGTASRFVLDLRRSEDAGFAPWPLERASALVEVIRDAAAERLRHAMQHRIAEIDRILVGRKPDGENAGPTSARVRIIPLASIGHPQADMQVRRILVEVPGECSLRADDIAWAVSGLSLDHPVLQDRIDLTRSDEESQLGFYGVNKPSRIWRSVTPVALPDAKRRRIDPDRVKTDEKEKKGGHEKFAEYERASFAVGQALRHANVAARVSSIRLQREPFDPRGVRVEQFAEGTRFSKHCLWHVELEFESLVRGPMLIGDGRFLGLGLMRPLKRAAGVYAFSIESGLQSSPDPIRLSKAMRRAVMARTRDVLGTYRLPPYFSGHAEDGSAGRSEEPHLAFAFDPLEQQLLVITPGQLDRRNSWRDAEHTTTLELALEGLHQLRAGEDGCLQLWPVVVDTTCHRLFQASRIWETCTPYDVNHHARKSTAETVLKRDVLIECERRGLPRPEVTVLKWKAIAGLGLQGWLRLEFKDAIPGLIILGRSRHVGGGLFAPVNENTSRTN
ncbi:MAG: type I-U CRISPR-associated protein Cas5/Cas6 [Planctomycetales bacterium]|nr:type I-U CRISPR-associated protein Cas5/Cas6 [Planctomycetales bacterium]